jgi:hypothetical protein
MYGKSGWFGNSQGHSLAGRGIRMYVARKSSEQLLVDPVFYAKKREEQVPTYELARVTRNGMSYDALRRHYPDADPEDLRLRGIKAIEMREGSPVLSELNRSGVDASVTRARENPLLRQRMLVVLKDPVMSSYLQQKKVEFLLDGLR